MKVSTMGIMININDTYHELYVLIFDDLPRDTCLFVSDRLFDALFW